MSHLHFSFQPYIWFWISNLLEKKTQNYQLYVGLLFALSVWWFQSQKFQSEISIFETLFRDTHRKVLMSWSLEFNAGQSSTDNLWVTFSKYFSGYFNSVNLISAKQIWHNTSCVIYIILTLSFLTSFMIGFSWTRKFPCVFRICFSYLSLTLTNANTKTWK